MRSHLCNRVGKVSSSSLLSRHLNHNPTFAATRRMSSVALASRANERQAKDYHHPWTMQGGLLAGGLAAATALSASWMGDQHVITQNEGIHSDPDENQDVEDCGKKNEKKQEEGAKALATSHTGTMLIQRNVTPPAVGILPSGLHTPGFTDLVKVTRRKDAKNTRFQVMKGLEVKEEGEKVRLAKFLRELHELANESATEEKKRTVTKLNRRYSTRALKATLSLDSTNLKTLTPEQARELVAGLSKEELLDKKSLIRLVHRCVEVLKEEDTLVDLRSASAGADANKKKRLTVVGDLHGSLKCLQRVLDIVGDLGDTDNQVVFCGDFVDRGDNSLEVFFTLLLFKLVYPKNIILLRGNHEDTMIASVYGFCDEIQHKYGQRRGDQIFKAISELFAALPIAAVTDNSFIVHGGLPHDHFSLDQIAAITPKERSKMFTVMENGCEKELLLESLMWSDPSIFDGIAENPRGCGIEFGPDVAKDFLDREGLTYILRGHEPAENGTQVLDCGDGKAVVTVFSNANYPNGDGVNLGAVVQVDGEGNAQSVEFSYAGRKSTTEADAEKVLQSIIVDNRNSLIRAFETVQKGNKVTPQQWIKVMESTLMIPDVPWHRLQPTMAPTAFDTMVIDWRYHLDRVAPVLSNSLNTEQMDILTANKEQVRRVFELLDADGSGAIDKNEFILGVDMLNKKLLPPDARIGDAESLFNALDLDGNGEIDIQEFNMGMASSAAIQHLSSTLDEKQVDILRKNSDMLLAVFKFLDTDGSGSIDRSEFRTGIKLLNKRLPEASQFKDSDELFNALDSDGSGDIDIAEFNQVFQTS